MVCAGLAQAESLPNADIVILGEVHDNPHHHLKQADVLDALSPKAVVFEMFGLGGAGAIADIPRDDAEALATALEWEARGWPDFEIYAPVFAAIGDAEIFGAALPRDEVRRAIGEGAAKVFGARAGEFGLDQPLFEDEQSARNAGQMAAHCDALPVEMLPGMVEAQRLRDAGLAATALDALDVTGGPVAVITGNGHARIDWGIPALLAIARPELDVYSIGMLEAEPVGAPPYDQWFVTDPAPREDPCAAFR